MSSTDLNFASIWEAVTDAVPDEPAVVQGRRRVSWAAYEWRAARLAEALGAVGLTAGSKVALYLYNSPEYAEAQFAAFKLRGVPVNVNYRYLDDELAYLFDNSDAEAVVFHSSFGERIERIRKRCGGVRLWVEVDDGGDHLEGAEPYEDLLEAHDPAPRIRRDPTDRYLQYTGGTTGLPKGVEYEVGTLAASFLAQRPPLFGIPPATGADQGPAVARQLADGDQRDVAIPVCPLMHATGNWGGVLGPHVIGGTTVLLESRSLDAAEVWSSVEREGAASVVIVGDPFARPLLRELDEQTYDVGCLRVIVSSGAMFSAETKTGLLARIPDLAIVDTVGASEGVMGVDIATRDIAAETARFQLLPTTKVLSEDGHEVTPGSGESGFIAVSAVVPVGYYKDPAKSATTFKIFDGVRYSIPGDLATVRADGTIVLLGRGNNCINTGGEKVFPEEVEEALKTHPAVEDGLVFGVEDERLGQRIAAVVSLVHRSRLTEDELIAHVKGRLAGYKAPKSVTFTACVPRTPSGKADYGGARAVYDQTVAR